MNPQAKPQKNETHKARTKASQSDLDRRDGFLAKTMVLIWARN